MKYVFYDTTGSLFEESISEKILGISIKNWGKNSFKISSMKVDQYKGIDFTLLEIPMDITLNFHNKTYMRRLEKTIDLEVGKVHFGIRKANGKFRFEKPVLVLGFDFPHLKKSDIQQVTSLIKDQLSDVLETGMDLYLDAVYV